MRTSISKPAGSGGTTQGQRGFTLLELLAVIAIMGVVAGLIMGAQGAAKRTANKRLAETERDQLVTFIESYQAKRGVYPPDNPLDTTNNPLFYELSGTTNLNGTFVAPGAAPLPAATVQSIFKMGGFVNSFNPAGDAGDQSMQSFLKGLKDNQKLSLTNPLSGTIPYTLLCVPLPNPVNPTWNAAWNYLAAPHATNNSTTFDLWVDVKIGNQKFRISNWSKQPQTLN